MEMTTCFTATLEDDDVGDKEGGDGFHENEEGGDKDEGDDCLDDDEHEDDESEKNDDNEDERELLHFLVDTKTEEDSLASVSYGD